MDTEKKQLTHFDDSGRPQMVDVTDKEATTRVARATSVVQMKRETRKQIESQMTKKGDVRSIAELAGIMAAKRTPELIPLCHHIPLQKVNVTSQFLEDTEEYAFLSIVSEVKTTYQTGVEMEALTACSVAALTVYDMCKAIDRDMSVRDTRLLYKSGGRSGTFQLDGGGGEASR